MKKLSEMFTVGGGVENDDGSTIRVTPYAPAASHRQAMAVFTTQGIATTKKVTVQFKQADNVDGDNPVDLGDALVLTADGTEAFTGIHSVYLDAMAAGKTHVAASIITDDTGPKDVACILLLGESVYNPGVQSVAA